MVGWYMPSSIAAISLAGELAIVLRDAEGRIYVLEVNPLPGLTPGYSDLVLIAQAVGMEYDQLIAEIMRSQSGMTPDEL